MSSHKSTRRASRTSWWRSARLRAVLSLGVVLGVGTTGTMASWSDTAVATSGTFTTGRLDLLLGNPAVDANPPQFTTDFAMTGMVPGSTKDGVLRITNAGTVPFTFKASGSATNSGVGTDQLGAALRISVYPSSSAGVCTGTAIVTDQPVNGAFLPSQASLANAATRDLCFRATLPSAASTDLQGKSSVLTLTFTADQVAP